MAEDQTLKFQQVICPSCKRPINTFNPNKLMAECPYCHSKLVNPLVKPKDIPMPSRIIPFSTTEEDFEKALVKVLVQRDYVPTDIFEAISIKSVMQIYVPMFVYEGTYNAPWNCRYAVGSDEKNTQWFPQSGIATGEFSFLLLANESEDIPKELREFTKSSLYEVGQAKESESDPIDCDDEDIKEFLQMEKEREDLEISQSSSYDITMSKEFEPDMIDYEDDNLMILECNADARILWEKYGKDMVNSKAEEEAKKPTKWQKTRNFNVSSSFNLTSQMGEYVLVPFWFVYYNYGNEQFYFLMDGNGNRKSYTCPDNAKEKALIKSKQNEAGCFNVKAAPVALPLAVITALYFSAAKDLPVLGWILAAVVFLIVMGIGAVIKNGKIESEIEKILANSRDQRRAGADRL